MMRSDAGISLLEVIVAMALFVTVALMGAQVLRLSISVQSSATREVEASAELANGLALLRADLMHAMQLEPGVRPGAIAVETITLSALEAPTIASVTWWHDSGSKELRRSSSRDDPAGRAVFSDVDAFTVRQLLQDGTWAALRSPRQGEGDADPTGRMMPRAVDAVVMTGQGPLRVLVVP